MRSIIYRFGVALAATLAVPVAYGLCRALWPCFVPSRFVDRFPVVYAAVTAVLYLAFRIGTDLSVSRRLAFASGIAIVTFLLSQLTLSNLFGAADRFWQTQTKADLLTLASSLESVSGAIPVSPVDALPEWRAAAAQGKRWPSKDAWGNPILVVFRGADHYLISCGACGMLDAPDPTRLKEGPTTNFEANIVLLNRKFIRYPEGIQH